jgi:D-serine deaminase-like pyridoxal phosphate-dependent protein
MEAGEDNPVPRVGDRLELLPSHICATANLYDEFHVFREQSLIARWPITGRGRYT